ncbi:carboxylesterase family protein [Nanoarchaeota archaeon]
MRKNTFFSLLFILLVISSCGAKDKDGDGFTPPDDCDDGNSNIHPNSIEYCFDGVDNDCDGIADVGPICDLECKETDDYIFCPNVPYKIMSGVDPSLLSVDLYFPKELRSSDREYPVMMYVHGGGWTIGDKSNTHSKDEFFTENNYIFISVNYRLTSFDFSTGYHNGIKYPHHNEDLASAINWVYDNIRYFRGDINNLLLMGHSVGGGMVAAVGTNERFLETEGLTLNNIKCVVVLDHAGLNITERMSNCLEPVPENTCDGYIAVFGYDPLTRYVASPINNIESNKNIPKFFLVTKNNPFSISRSKVFADKLSKNSIYNKLLTVDYTHRQINVRFGDDRDTIMTPYVYEFLETKCTR